MSTLTHSYAFMKRTPHLSAHGTASPACQWPAVYVSRASFQ